MFLTLHCSASIVIESSRLAKASVIDSFSASKHCLGPSETSRYGPGYLDCINHFEMEFIQFLQGITLQYHFALYTTDLHYYHPP